MKQLAGIMVFAVFLLFTGATWQQPSPLSGDGNVTVRALKIGNIRKVEINGLFKTYIAQSNGSNEVKVETDKNLQSTIEVIQNGDRLIVRSRKGAAIQSSTKMNVYIGLGKAALIDVKSAGNLEFTTPLKCDSIEINSTMSGKSFFHIESNFVRFNLKNTAQTTIAGWSKDGRINNRSVADVEAVGFVADTLYLHNDAAGNITVCAQKEMAVRQKGSGNISYKGSPVIKELKQEGTGKIEKIK